MQEPSFEVVDGGWREGGEGFEAESILGHRGTANQRARQETGLDGKARLFPSSCITRTRVEHYINR